MPESISGEQVYDNHLQEAYDAALALYPGAQREAALHEVWRQTSETIERYSGRRLPRDAAGDVTQETIIGILGALERYRENDSQTLSLDALARTIAKRRSIDHYRSAERKPDETTYEDWQDSRTDSDATGEESVLLGESSERTDRLLQILPPHQRRSVYLTVMLGMSATEAAAEAGSTPGSIRVGKFHGLRRLASLIRLPDEELPPAYEVRHRRYHVLPASAYPAQTIERAEPTARERAEVLQPYVAAMFRLLYFPDDPATVDAITGHLAGELNRYQAWARSGERAGWFTYLLDQAERHVPLFMETDIALGHLRDPETGEEYAADNDDRLVYAACISRLINVSTTTLYLHQRNTRQVRKQSEELRRRMIEPVEIPDELEPHDLSRTVWS